MHRFTVDDVPRGGRKSEARDGRAFAQKLHDVRKHVLVTTQADLARYAGMSDSAVAAIESARGGDHKGARVASPGAITRLLVACGVEAHDAVIAAAGSTEAVPSREASSLRTGGHLLLAGLAAPAVPAVAAAALVGVAGARLISSRKSALLPAERRRLAETLAGAVSDAKPHPRAPAPYRLFDLPDRNTLVEEIGRLSRGLPLGVLAAFVDQLRTVSDEAEQDDGSKEHP